MFTPALLMQSVSGSRTPLATYVPRRSRLIRTMSGLLAPLSDVTNAWGAKLLSLNFSSTPGYFFVNVSIRAWAMTSLVLYETPYALSLPEASIGACDPAAGLAPALPLASAVALASALPAALGAAAVGAAPLVDGDPPAVLQAPTIRDRATSA